MKATYTDFIQANPNCSKFINNAFALAVFDLLSKDDNIIAMIDACEMRPKKPALSACAKTVEALSSPTFDLDDKFTRTAVGRMVKIILAPFGYTPVSQRDLEKNLNCTKFKSASCYEKNIPETMHVVKIIRSV